MQNGRKDSALGFWRMGIASSRLSVQEVCQIFASAKKVLNVFFTLRLQFHKTPFKTVMLKYPRLFLTPFRFAICGIALLLCSCATVTESSSQARMQQLETAHLDFIKHHTCVEGALVTWDQASFDSEVAKITQQFTDAEAAESKAVPARKEFIKNSANLFQRDAALIQKKHCLSPSFAANKEKQLQQNYDILLHQP